MKDQIIKVNGIYDQRTLAHLAKKESFTHFNFDLRPTSLNFVPQHNLQAMMENQFSTQHQYFLQFGEEKDFVIESIFMDLEERLGANSVKKSFLLEIAAQNLASYLKEYRFVWHYKDEVPLEKLCSRFLGLQGVVFNPSQLMALHGQRKIERLQAVLQEIAKDRFFSIELHLDWEGRAFPSLLDSLEFTHFGLPINNRIETSYRRVDLEKLDLNMDILMERLPLSQRRPLL